MAVYFLLKVLITAIVVAAVSDLAKRSSALAAILASLPLTSILALLWLWYDTRDSVQVSLLTRQIFFALLPSLLFFIIFPLLLRAGWRFGSALSGAIGFMLGGYFVYVWILARLGIRL
ncbi:MAG: DUF3147 family protein [Desulfuromonadales bacterium]|nr:DUF3147 family protein [Desulfuromonadales bacterium]